MSSWSPPIVVLCYWKVTIPPPAVMATKIQLTSQRSLVFVLTLKALEETVPCPLSVTKQLIERDNMFSLLLWKLVWLNM